MDYWKHYNLIIERARTRSITGYVERHHITPRCMGGGDEPQNIVALTPEEHMVAHQLLAKMYQDHPGIAFGALMMATRVSNKKYGWLRRNFAEKMSGIDRSSWKAKETQSAEHKRKIAEAVKKSWENPEIRQKQVAAMKGRVLSDQHKAALSASRQGKKLSEEHKRKIGLAHRGAKHTMSKLTCIHCQKTGGATNMKRYHFDYCKSNPDNRTN
jgi:hypothetical protein